MSAHPTTFAQLDICPKCKGTFFDSGEGVAAHGPAVEASFLLADGRAERLRPSRLRCPAHGVKAQGAYRDAGRLEPADDSPTMNVLAVKVGTRVIEIDACPECRGFFLDAGEPEQLLAIAEATTKSGGDAKSFWSRIFGG